MDLITIMDKALDNFDPEAVTDLVGQWGKCKVCGSHEIVKAGIKRLKTGIFQQYKCYDCTTTFYRP